MDNPSESHHHRDPNAELKRKRYIKYAIASFTLIFVVYFLYWLLYSRFYIATDNAYVNGNIVQVAPQLSGTINHIYADLTDYVSAGQILFTLEQNDTEVRLAHARANLAKAIREVQQQMSMVQQYRAIVGLRKAELVNANSIFNSRATLWNSRNVSHEAWQAAKTARDIAEAQYQKSLYDLEASMALMKNSTSFNHPLVEAAKSDFKTAYLDQERTVVVSPVNGYIAKRNAQVGSIVTPGMWMYAIVPLNEIWVDANFKETQLHRLRVGQPVELIADKNNRRYHGKIAGFYPGTGSVFSLLPAQNASGNWIKISQRLPVRINLVDQQEIQQSPLEIGLSMSAIVDTHDLDLPDLRSKHKLISPLYSTDIHQHQLEKAEVEIQKIYNEQTKPVSSSDALTGTKTMHEFRGARLAILTLGLSLGLFMNLLDASIANVSIPYIAGSLNVSPTQGTWIITSFSVSTAIILPLTGWLALRFGEVRLFIISTILFTVASVLCGLSANLPMLVFSRVLQGIFAAPMIPLSQSLLLSHYPSDKKGLATGLWVMTAVFAPILGPVLGGYITYHYSWSWIFYINVPIGILSVYLCWVLLRGEETPIQKMPIDMIGLCLIVLTVGCLQVTLDKGHELDWYSSTTIQLLTVTGIISAILFFIWEIFEKYPIIDLSLFKIHNFTIGVTALFLGQSMYFGCVIVYTLWLQLQMGYTSSWAGLAVMPVGLLAVVFTPVVGSLLYRFPARWFAMFGFLVLAVSAFWSSSFNTDSTIWQLSYPRLLIGLGLSFFFSPLFFIIVSNMEPERVTSALGIANFLRTLGASLGTSIYVTLWDDREKFHYAHLTESLSDYHINTVEQLRQFNLAGFSQMNSKAILDQVVAKQSFLLSINELYWATGFLFVILCVLMLFVKPNKNAIHHDIMVE